MPDHEQVSSLLAQFRWYLFWGLFLWMLVYGMASLIGLLNTFDITYPLTTGFRRLATAILYSTGPCLA